MAQAVRSELFSKKVLDNCIKQVVNQHGDPLKYLYASSVFWSKTDKLSLWAQFSFPQNSLILNLLGSSIRNPGKVSSFLLDIWRSPDMQAVINDAVGGYELVPTMDHECSHANLQASSPICCIQSVLLPTVVLGFASAASAASCL